MQARLNKISQHKKRFTWEALAVALKKNQDFLPFFPDLYFTDFFQFWKIAGQT